MARRKLTNRDTQKQRIKMEPKKDTVLMKECIEDAKQIVLEKRLMESQSAIVEIAIALFNSRCQKELK